MSDIVKRTATELGKSDSPVSREAGSLALTAGLGGGALWFAAGLIPFINFPVLLVLAVVAGLYLKTR